VKTTQYKASTALRKAGCTETASEHQTMTAEDPIVEEIEITGHIIDSLILPKVLDTITAGGGKFRITNIAIGQSRHDPSNAVVEVRAPNEERMQHILAQIADHWRRANDQTRLPPRRRRYGRRIPGGLLQLDKPTNRNSPR